MAETQTVADALRGNMAERGWSQVETAEVLGVSMAFVNQLVTGRKGITARSAWMLSAAFDTTPEFWMRRQIAEDLRKARPAQLPQPSVPHRRCALHARYWFDHSACGEGTDG